MALLISACSTQAGVSIGNSFTIGTIWDSSSTEEGTADWESAAPIAEEQHEGFSLSLEQGNEFDLSETAYGEGNRQDDIQVAIREMVEGDDAVALVGASSNEASMRAASIANFFNLPMIIPSADGSSVLPDGNLWAFRISPVSEAYSSYLFNDVLASKTAENRIDPARLKIAILYEQNTFGESAAVATATYAMDNLVEIGVYDYFSETDADQEELLTLAQSVIMENVDIVYLISSQPETATNLVKAFENSSGLGRIPLLIGQAGGFSSQEFLNSKEAEAVIVLQQAIITDDCPKEIESIYQAQSYACIFLLDQSLQNARNTYLKGMSTSIFENLNPNSAVDPMVQFREILRDEIKDTNSTVPCIGKLAFDNNGENRYAVFELIRTDQNGQEILTIEEFLMLVKEELNSID